MKQTVKPIDLQNTSEVIRLMSLNVITLFLTLAINGGVQDRNYLSNPTQ